MKIKLLILAFLSCLTFLSVSGQDIVKPGIYTKSISIHNPATETIRKENYNSLDIYAKHKFIDNINWKKDMNIMLNYAGRYEKVAGFWTASYLYDNYSYYNRHIFTLGYGTNWNFSEERYLSVGARGVFNFDNVRWYNLYNYQGSDDRESLYLTPDVDIGIEYGSARIRTGISLRNAIGTARDLRRDGVILYNRRMLFSYVEYRHYLASDYEIGYHLSTYFERSLTADIGFSLKYKEKFNLIYTFRVLEARHVGGFMIDFEKLNLGIVCDISHLHRDHNLEIVMGMRF